MENKQKIVFKCKLSKVLYLIFLVCIPLKFYGQDFEWVYSTKATEQQGAGLLPRALIKQVVTDSNNDIYIAGWLDNSVDFGDGQDGFIRNTTTSTTSFVAKLNENKEVIWLKDLRLGYYIINTIILDENEDIVISGHANANDNSNPSFYFDTNPPNPIFPNILNPTHQNLDPIAIYGFIYKLDTNGNYIDAKLFKDILVNNIIKDQNNDIVAVGSTVEYDTVIPSEYDSKWGYIIKLDTNFNTIWEKTLNNQNSNSNNSFRYVSCDSQNNIYCTGNFTTRFVYGNTILENDDANHFVSKMSPNGSENWIVDFRKFPVSQIRIDNSDGIYFFANYASPFSVQFNNQVVENLPIVMNNELVFFKINTSGNLIWNIPIYGSGEQEVSDFSFNSLGELIILIKSGKNTLFNFANQATSIETNSFITVILKVKPDGELVDYKRVYENTAQNHIYTNAIHIDVDDDIILGGTFNKTTDFDPHVSNQYILVPEEFESIIPEVFFNDHRGFVLKLKNCESLPFFGDIYEICSGTVPNPTIADIKDSGPNIKFYTSMASTTPLSSDFPLIHGQTLYYENIVSSCSNIGRFPVQINILPKSNPPIVSALQPCFYQELQLADIDVQGQNVLFYLNPSGGESVNDNLYLNPNMTYYVTQNYNNCESNRVPFSVYQMTLLTDTYTATICDQDKNNTEMVNLTDYIQYFTGSTSNGFSVIYFNSHEDALNNQNAISNVETFTTSNQTVFIRLFSTNNSCFEIVQLNLSLVYPTEITEIKVDDLVENNTVTIFPYDGNFVYSLDGITFQTSNVFSNVSSGEYYAYIKDVTANCITISDKFYVLSYPKFFTPNGDGINDFWRIRMSQFQYSIDVEIYDRYGKFITNFDKNNGGWDGKHKGKELPATDYWFKIIKTIDKETIYFGHFSLIR